MAVFTIERYGFVSLYNLVSSIGQDMKDHGFTAVVDSVSGATVEAEITTIIGAATISNTKVTRPSPTYSFGVTSVTVENPGTKYDPANPPTVTLSPPVANGRQIMLDAGYTLAESSGTYSTTWNDPSIVGNYDVTLLTNELNGLPVGATATAQVNTDGTLAGITITNTGFGYTQDQAVVATLSGGRKSVAQVILESTAAVDPMVGSLPSSQPWRICFDLRGAGAISDNAVGGSLGVYLGTSATLTNAGIIAYNVANPSSPTDTTKIEPAGNTGAKWTSNGGPAGQSADQCFFNREARSDASIASAYPMSYRLTITDRGVFLGVWEANAEESGRGFNWLLVQRSVDRLTGVTRGSTVGTANGRCPVYCLNAVNNKYYKFVVREQDLVMPSERKIATDNSEDNAAVINEFNQQSLTESGEYVITFISNLNSSRYKYADELDMIGTVSADVVGAATEIDVTVYGEALPRTYHALYPNKAYGTGMRLMVLVSNPNES